MTIEGNVTLIRCLLFYSAVVFTLNLLLLIYKQLFLSHPFGTLYILFVPTKSIKKLCAWTLS